MSFMVVGPDALVASTSDLANIGSAISAATSAAANSTTGLLAAGADEVSAAIAALFSEHGEMYQAVSASAEAFHAQFVQVLNAGAGAYASAEAAKASPLQGVLDVINAPTQVLLGRPLIGDGANGRRGKTAALVGCCMAMVAEVGTGCPGRWEAMAGPRG